MIIIFESPDKTGKTTLAKMIADELGIKYMKMKNISIEDNVEIKDIVSIATHSQIETVVQLYKNGLLKDMVLDRFHASEFVYNNLFQRNYDISYINKIEDKLLEHNDVLLIKCKTSSSKLRARWLKDEKLLDEDKITNVQKLYEEFYKNTKIPYIEIDTNTSIELSFAMIMKELYNRGIYKNHLRERRATHVEAMMDIAKTISKRSPDLSRQVGSVLTENGFIIGVGYNGPPSGLNHDETCPRRSAGYGPGEALDMSRALHAEQNVLLQAGLRFNRTNNNLELFCTDQPCIHCMRMCIQAGIKKIYYINPYPHPLAIEMAEEANIELIQYEE